MNYTIEHGWPKSRQEQQTRPPELIEVFECIGGLDGAIFQARRFLDMGQTVCRIKNSANEVILDQEAVWRRVYGTSDEI